VTVGSQAVRVNFFDMAGGEQYREIRAEFYRDAQGVLLVFDVTRRPSFEALDSWIVEAEANGLQQPATVLCANKCDGAKRAVTEAEGKKWAGSHSMRYFETSAKEGDNVKLMFETLFQQAVESR
jgi:small GTP-binding protein